MRKRLLIIMMISLLALSACGKSEEGKNRETSKEEVTEVNQTSTEVTTQATEATTEAIAEVTTEASTESTTTTEATTEAIDYSDRLVAYELKETDNPYINELLNMSGEYTDSVDNTCTYHYQIPQFNGDSDSAKALNQKIEADLYKIVETEVTNMDGGFSLIAYTLTYEVIQYGDIVAIVATVPYPNDCSFYYAYTYDFGNDKELTNSDLIAMSNMTEDEFIEKACKMGEDYFLPIAANIGMSDDETESFLEEARSQTTVNAPMYLDENGVLNAYVPFPSVAGASTYDTLCQFN